MILNGPIMPSSDKVPGGVWRVEVSGGVGVTAPVRAEPENCIWTLISAGEPPPTLQPLPKPSSPKRPWGEGTGERDGLRHSSSRWDFTAVRASRAEGQLDSRMGQARD